MGISKKKNLIRIFKTEEKKNKKTNLIKFVQSNDFKKIRKKYFFNNK